jgi:hypothetical protein
MAAPASADASAQDLAGPPPTQYAPTMATSGRRTIAVETSTDGRLFINWWDLGGGGNGWSEVPGGLRTNVAASAGLVDTGRYVFVMANAASDNAVWLNQGAPQAQDVWAGWQ